MTDQPIRAEWWREVTDPDEVIPKGCPVRLEVGDTATEWIAEGNLEIEPFINAHKPRFFKDSRWTPPRPAYKVGDVIERDCEEGCPTEGVGIVDALGTVAQIFDGTVMWTNRGEDEWGSLLQRHLPVTVIYVPERGGDDD